MRTAEKLSLQPMDPINKACGSWAESKAAYRLFRNEKVKCEKILASHREKTIQRMIGQERVLTIQDTSSINFGERLKTRKKGLGPVGKKEQGEDGKSFGLIMHTTLAVNMQGVSLGILDQQLWARGLEVIKADKTRHRRKRDEKETHKWFLAAERVQAYLPSPAPTEVIHVSDREADIYEYLAFAQSRGISFLVRANFDRLVKDHHFYPLWHLLESNAPCAQAEVDVPAKKTGEAARTAKVNIGFKAVEIAAPPPKNKKQAPLDSLKLYAVYVKEENPPAGVTALEWMLLTNVAVKDAQEAQERVRWYRMRWHIETFHKVLKSGCQVEACQLEGAERLKKYVALMSVIAWRIYWMTHLSRHEPEASCEELLEEAQWKSLSCRIHKTKEPPDHPPSISQAIRWIAQLGGFLARKGDGDPGPMVIWRGWQRLTDITEDWLIFKGAATCG